MKCSALGCNFYVNPFTFYVVHVFHHIIHNTTNLHIERYYWWAWQQSFTVLLTLTILLCTKWQSVSHTFKMQYNHVINNTFQCNRNKRRHIQFLERVFVTVTYMYMYNGNYACTCLTRAGTQMHIYCNGIFVNDCYVHCYVHCALADYRLRFLRFGYIVYATI